MSVMEKSTIHFRLASPPPAGQQAHAAATARYCRKSISMLAVGLSLLFAPIGLTPLDFSLSATASTQKGVAKTNT